MSPSAPVVDLAAYHQSSSEQARTTDLIRLLPRNRRSILDVGARDGYFSRMFPQYFQEVTALDLKQPSWELAGVKTVAGDATRLNFPDNSFDVVFCAEVLEHIPKVEAAARELARVARHEVLIGVPFRQDIRIGRHSCPCGHVSPPWGHVNTFTREKLEGLFAGLRAGEIRLVGENATGDTNVLSTWLMDLAGNPWATICDEPCLGCGAPRQRPSFRSIGQRVCSGAAHTLNTIQRKLFYRRPHAKCIHVLFCKSV